MCSSPDVISNPAALLLFRNAGLRLPGASLPGGQIANRPLEFRHFLFSTTPVPTAPPLLI